MSNKTKEVFHIDAGTKTPVSKREYQTAILVYRFGLEEAMVDGKSDKWVNDKFVELTGE